MCSNNSNCHDNIPITAKFLQKSQFLIKWLRGCDFRLAATNSCANFSIFFYDFEDFAGVLLQYTGYFKNRPPPPSVIFLLGDT